MGPTAVAQMKGTAALSVIALGPLLYFYVKAEAIPHFELSSRDWKHLFPFIFGFGIVFMFTSMDDEQRLVNLLSPIHFNIVDTFRLTGVFLLLWYIIKSYRFVRNHQNHLSEISCMPSAVAMRWAYGIIFFVFGIFLMKLLLVIAGAGHVSLTLSMEFLLVGFLLIAVFSHRYSLVFSNNSEEQSMLRKIYSNAGEIDETDATEPESSESDENKYKNSPLTEDQLILGVKRIVKLLNDDHEAFYDPNFRLSDLAKLIRMPSYLTSQVVNQGMEKNFYDLINEQRIRKAKKLLSNHENGDLSIISIAYDVGYNSKSAFNTAFKKYAHMTPSEFRKSQIQSVSY